MAVWQSLLATDVKFNSYRAPSYPGFKGTYIRRRSQLLKNSLRFEDNPKAAQAYLNLRTSLLQQRYGVTLDQLSQRSQRSTSRLTIDGDVLSTPPLTFKGVLPGQGPTKNVKGQVFPTYKAEASKVFAGGTSIVENYAFSGVFHIFDQHKDSVTMLKFGNHDSSLLAFCSLDGNLSICRLDEDQPRVVHKLQKHTAGVTAFDWSTSNDLIVSAGMDGQICLWDVQKGQCLRSVLDQSKAQVLSCIFHPLNSNWIVAGNSVGLVEVMNISTGRYSPGGSSQVAGAVPALTFDVSGEVLWAGNAKGSVNSFKFDFSSGKLRKGKRIIVHEGTSVTSLCAKTWASRESRNPSLLVNCACNFLFLYRITDNDGGLKIVKKIPIPHLSHPIQSTFSPIMSFRKGSCVVTGSEDCEVWVLDIERDSSFAINKLQGHSAPVLSVSFNYNESHLASSDASGLVIVWK